MSTPRGPCLECSATSSPGNLWRSGPQGRGTLCNRCGLKWAASLKKRDRGGKSRIKRKSPHQARKKASSEEDLPEGSPFQTLDGTNRFVFLTNSFLEREVVARITRMKAVDSPFTPPSPTDSGIRSNHELDLHDDSSYSYRHLKKQRLLDYLAPPTPETPFTLSTPSNSFGQLSDCCSCKNCVHIHCLGPSSVSAEDIELLVQVRQKIADKIAIACM